MAAIRMREDAPMNRVWSLLVAIHAFGSLGACSDRLSAQDQIASDGTPLHSPKRMADGKLWTTRNLTVTTVHSYLL
jgi:hypothetical protein